MIASNLPPEAEPLISLFETSRCTTPDHDLPLSDLVDTIRSNHMLKPRIAAIRLLVAKGDTKAADKRKGVLPAVSLSAHLRTRDANTPESERLVAHSGYLQCDFDAKDNPGVDPDLMVSKLSGLNYVRAAFISPSGNGAKAVVAIPPSVGSHLQSWATVKQKMQADVGLVMDAATKDPFRLCYLSHDPDIYYNPDSAVVEPDDSIPVAEVLPIMEKRGPGRPPGAANKVKPLTAWDVRFLLSFIPPRPEYQKWCKVISAVLATGLPQDVCLELLEAWSPAEKPGDYEAKLRSPLAAITVGTLIHYATEGGWTHERAEEEKTRAALEREGVIAPAADETGFTGVMYYAGAAGFYYRTPLGKWIPLPQEGAARQHLVLRGVPKENVERAVCMVRELNHVHYVGGLAGHKEGLITNAGDKKRMLIIDSPTIIDPDPSVAFPATMEVISGVLGQAEYGEGQVEFFLHWLKAARENLEACVRCPLPVAVLVGRRGAGKSLIGWLANYALGGRSAKCYDALKGGRFNSKVAQAELLIVDDEADGKDHKSRTTVTQNIKNMLYNDTASVESKFKDGFDAAPIWAMMFMVNDEPDDLRVLPIVNESTSDKIALLHATGMDYTKYGGRDNLIKTLDSELPGFIHYIKSLPVPAAWSNSTDMDVRQQMNRQRVVTFHHPEVVSMIGDLQPDTRLRQLIYQCATLLSADEHNRVWIGTADHLSNILREDPVTASSARSLLSYNETAGKLLSSLARRDPGFVRVLPQHAGITVYEITVPEGVRDYATPYAIRLPSSKPATPDPI